MSAHIGLSLHHEGEGDEGACSQAEDVAEEEEQEEEPDGPPVAAGKQRGKAKAKAAGAGKGKGKGRAAKAEGKRKGAARTTKTMPQQDGELDGYKKCNRCRKWLGIDDFNADQCRCKKCDKRIRSFARLTKNENVETDMTKMEKEQPKEYDKMFTQYCRHCDSIEKTQSKQQFAIHAVIREYKSKEGVRSHGEYEMMWEAEYFEWAGTAKAGFLSESEKKANWAAMQKDPKVKRDNFGPRGFLRCGVKVKDVVHNFSEAVAESAVQSQARLSKNISEEQLQRQVAAAMQGVASSSNSVVDWERIMQRGVAADDVDPHDSVLGSLMEPTIGDLRLGAAERKKKAGAVGDEGSDAGAVGDSDGGDDDGDARPTTPKKRKAAEPPAGDETAAWWSADTKTNKAERSYAQKFDVHKTTLDTMDKTMSAAVAEFRALKDSSLFCIEMGVVLQRQRWMQCIRSGTPEDMRALIAEIDQGSQSMEGEVDAESCVSGSKDLSSLARAGPCANYDKLVVLTTFESHKGTSKGCKDQEELTAWSNEMNNHKQIHNVFLSACRIAVTDMYAARTSHKATQDEKKKLEAEARSKEGCKRKASETGAAARKRAMVSGIELLNLESPPLEDHFAISTADSIEELTGLDLRKPFLLKNQAWLLEIHRQEKVQKVVSEFVEEFNQSTMKVTEGRCQVSLDDVDRVVAKEVHDGFKASIAPLRFAASADASASDPLPKALAPALFGIAGGHIAPGRYELHEMGTLRAALLGTRQVGLVDSAHVAIFLKKGKATSASDFRATELPGNDIINFVNKATSSDWDAFRKAGHNIFAFTAGPSDVVYIPSGYVVTHKAHSTDVVGFRIGVYCAQDMPICKMLLADRVRHGKKNPVMDQIIAVLAAEANNPGEAAVAVGNGKDERQSEQEQQEAKATSEAREADGNLAAVAAVVADIGIDGSEKTEKDDAATAPETAAAAVAAQLDAKDEELQLEAAMKDSSGSSHHDNGSLSASATASAVAVADSSTSGTKPKGPGAPSRAAPKVQARF